MNAKCCGEECNISSVFIGFEGRESHHDSHPNHPPIKRIQKCGCLGWSVSTNGGSSFVKLMALRHRSKTSHLQKLGFTSGIGDGGNLFLFPTLWGLLLNSMGIEKPEGCGGQWYHSPWSQKILEIQPSEPRLHYVPEYSLPTDFTEPHQALCVEMF